MTKEVAEKIARGIKDKIECNTVDIDDWAEFWGFTREEYEEFLEVGIKALEAQPKTGHWINHREHCENLGVMPSGLGAYEWCSNCDCGIDVKEFHKNHYNFCPHCGADMRGEDNGE